MSYNEKYTSFSKAYYRVYGEEPHMEQAPSYKLTEDYKVAGLTSLFYEALDYQGRKNLVFAYYACPEGRPPKGGWPGIVLVHGGGGTAFPWMVKAWNERGFAAISMDLEGHLPQLDVSHDLRSCHERSGPARKECFEDDGLDSNEQWFYHAMADVILAHSLIRSFDHINPSNIGIFGISWGGILTCSVLGLDHRFTFGISAYGCGYYGESDGVLNPEAGRGSQWDPYNFLGACHVPVLFINGTNDRHFPLDTWQKTTALVQKAKVWSCLKLRLDHSHMSPYTLEEPFEFAKRVTNASFQVPLIMVEENNGLLSIGIKCEFTIHALSLCYTIDEGIRESRLWHEKILGHELVAFKCRLPQETKAYYMSLTAVDGCVYSSNYYEL